MLKREIKEGDRFICRRSETEIDQIRVIGILTISGVNVFVVSFNGDPPRDVDEEFLRERCELIETAHQPS